MSVEMYSRMKVIGTKEGAREDVMLDLEQKGVVGTGGFK